MAGRLKSNRREAYLSRSMGRQRRAHELKIGQNYITQKSKYFQELRNTRFRLKIQHSDQKGELMSSKTLFVVKKIRWKTV